MVTLEVIGPVSGLMTVGDSDTVPVFVIVVPFDAVTVAVIVSVADWPTLSSPIVQIPVELT